jgi:uncharacterized protein (DUF302 family)
MAMAEDGLITVQSAHDFATTLDRLTGALAAKGITVFARVDHAAGAASVGQTMRPTTLVIFGNPAAGTPLMQASQITGIDLPLKALVWQAADGAVNVTYNDPHWIAARHRLGDKASQPVAAMAVLLGGLARQTTAP